jgi:drug/metabolite transporter (DMT)-like permease
VCAVTITATHHVEDARQARMNRERFVGLACAAASVLLFASFTLASRLGFASRLHLVDLAALRFGIGGLLLFPALLRADLKRISWRQAAALALFGGVGFAPLAYAGFSLAPATHGAALLHGTLPLSTYVLLRATGSTSAPRQALGALLIAGGVALMASDSLKFTGARQLLGDALLLFASLSWSAYGVLSRRLGLPATSGAAVVAVLSMFAFLPFYALWPEKALPTVGAREFLPQAVVQGVLIGAVSILVYTRAVASLGPATTALFAAAVPVLTTLLAIPLLSELPSRVALAGVGAVTLGMLAAARP